MLVGDGLTDGWLAVMGRRFWEPRSLINGDGLLIYNGFLWIFMDFYGFLWIFMDFYGVLWMIVDGQEG